MRHVSKSSLTQVSGLPSPVTEKPDTQCTKLLISYAPGVQAGSDSTTGDVPVPEGTNVIATSTLRCCALARVYVTS